MRVRVVASTCGGVSKLQYASSYIVNNCLAIDAGCLGMSGTPPQQASIRHVFLTHSHIDHIASLPIFLENAFEPGQETVAVHGAPEVLESLQRHIFNDVIWPDFVRLSIDGHPLVRLVPLSEESAIQIGDLSIVPVAVRHVVPAYGYIVTDGASTVVFGGDSGPTDRIWQLARNAPGTLSVFLEACFPDEMIGLATISGHLTPTLVAEELRKVPEAKTIVATHIKAKYHDKVVEELMALRIPGLVIGEAELEYQFGGLP
jgi:ribonuclease BN (tRNA processing enzyme)